MFNAPIKNGLNRRRKCTGINPYEMTLDYVVATKARVRQQQKKPAQTEAFVAWRPPGGWGLGGGGGVLIVGGFVVQL